MTDLKDDMRKGGTIASDAVDLLAGNLLGRGQFRDVYEAAWAPQAWVVKVELEACRFSNAIEWQFWQDHQYGSPDVARWLAPCGEISSNGIWLAQERTWPVPAKDLPAKLPSFLADVKPANFGRLANGRIVCHDYAIRIERPSVREVKAQWT